MTTTLPRPATARPMLAITYESDQADVPPAVREADLLDLARHIASATDPVRPVQLKGKDCMLAAMALPHLADDDIRRVLTQIVAELHEAELADRIDPREADYVSPERHRDCAANLARALVEADIQAGAA